MKKISFIFGVMLVLLSLTAMANATLLYSENFDSDNGGYTHSGTNDEWEWTSNRGYWGTDIGGYYNNNSNQILMSTMFALDIDTTQAVNFSFDYSFYTEENYDFVTFEYTYDGGSNWTQLSEQVSGTSAWNTAIVDVSSIYTDTFQAGWRLTSDCCIRSWGFYVDNVSINGELNTPVPEPATLILLGSGLAGLAFYRRKKTK